VTEWPQVFGPLAAAIARHRLPVELLDALLDAFVQDVTVTRYADRPMLLDYCRRSANPVGRLLLHLYGVFGAEQLARSDAICTALQLANFWQDLGVDTRRGRLYLPEVDCRRHGVEPAEVLAGRDSDAVHRLVAEAVAWARELMRFGAPLVHAVPGRAGWELRLVVQGGLRVLERIDRLGGATLRERPKLGLGDALPIAWRALAMRHDAVAPAHAS
jgi:squalene synthase HpnC